MSKIKKVYHKKSNVVVNGAPKLPTASQIDYGELAINYAPGVETLSIKNSSGDVVTFSSDTVKEKDERVIAEALNDLNSRVIDVEQDVQNIPQNVSELNNDVGYVTSSHTHSEYASSAHTHTAAEVGAMATSERSNYSTTAHTHSQYATTAHTHTAAEVGAMATSERGNYLTTATTIPTEASISASGFTKNGIVTETDPTVPAWAKAESKPSYTASEVGAMATSERSNYSTTAHTHSQYATTAHTHTASEVGAMATSERSNYATTAHTHTASEVGAMATSERSNYATTAHTHSEYASSAHTHTASEVGAMATSERSNYSTTAHTHSQYATTAHTHTASEVGAMATSERSNYSTTAHTHSQYATTAHTHTASEVGAMATSERSNYLTTATTIPTESTISASGFTKNAVTGINVNGSSVTVTNGVADITVQGGGSTLPSVTASDNGKVLMVVDGAWAAVMPSTVYTGTDMPLSSMGNDGDIYLQV